MPHSPLASMMADQSTLAAHQHLMSTFGQGLTPRTSQPSSLAMSSALQEHFQRISSQAGKVSPHHERHTPQSDEHSAGSGSVGAGPRLSAQIDVKIEEVRVQQIWSTNIEKLLSWSRTNRFGANKVNRLTSVIRPLARCQHHLTLRERFFVS